MKTIALIFSLLLTAIVCRAEEYHLKQAQVRDEVPMHGSVDKSTIYVLLYPDQRVCVFRTVNSPEMEAVVKNFPSGSVLHYDGNALIKPPKQAEIEKLMAFCKSKGITLKLTPQS